MSKEQTPKQFPNMLILKQCPSCKGSGKVILKVDHNSWAWDYLPYGATQPKTCTTCNGSGKVV